MNRIADRLGSCDSSRRSRVSNPRIKVGALSGPVDSERVGSVLSNGSANNVRAVRSKRRRHEATGTHIAREDDVGRV